MRFCGWFLFTCFLPVVVCGCRSGKEAVPPGASGVRAEDLVGKWRLVRAGGEPPAAVDIKSLRLDIAADGTWSTEIEMQGQWAGMSMKGGGKWSLADGVVRYTNGSNSGKSHVWVESGRLVLDPDFSVRKGGTTEVIGEYER
jgi:hypothetical protein